MRIAQEPVEWTGAVHAALYAQLGAKDCDLIVRVSDVYPDGRSILIADYHRRASFRAGLNLPPTPLAVGEIAEVKFRVGWLSQVGLTLWFTSDCVAIHL